MRRVFRDELSRRSGAGESWIFVWKMLQLCPKNPAAKSSLFVSLVFFRVLLFLGVLLHRVLWGELWLSIGALLGARFCC